MATLFHGVEAVNLDTVPRSVRVVNTSIIFIVGSAPTYLLESGNQTVNQLLRLTSDADDSLYVGPKRSGFTLPSALDILRDYGVSNVEVVNVFDPAADLTSATAQPYTFSTTGADRDTIQLKRSSGDTAANAEGLQNVVVSDVGGTPTYVLDTDYSLDAINGVITRIDTGAIASGGSVEVDYDWADPALVLASDVVGGVTGGVRTGLSLAYDMYSLRGYRPKINIAPGYSHESLVATEMEAIAGNVGYGCMAYLDAPNDTTVAEALAGRNGTSPVETFGTALPQTKLFYPRVSLAGTEDWLSTHAAGVRHQLDATRGYHYSASNVVLRKVDAMEISNLAITDREDLNKQGITTLYRDFATGIRLWGNHSAAYPSSQSPYSFEAVYRSIGIIHEALVEASLDFVDQPITPTLGQQILATANGFLAQENARNGAVVAGSNVRYLPEKNPPTQLAAGTLVFSISLMIPVPAQKIRYETELNIDLLSDALREVA